MIGLNGDADVRALAQRKTGSRRVDWRPGLADELPLPDASADRVVMSLLLHHLAPDAKQCRAARGSSRPAAGGRLHIADWGRPGDPLMRMAFLVLQLIDGFAGTRDHAAGRLPGFLTDAGLTGVTAHARLRTIWGHLELLSATRP